MSPRRCGAALSVMALVGCAAAQPQPTARPSRRYVLLSANTALHGTRGGEVSARTAASGPSAWRLVSERGEWLRVESVAPTSSRRHCAAVDASGAGRRRYWASSASRATVIARDTTVTFDAVSSLRVSAGMPAAVSPEGVVTMELDGLRVTARVDPEAVSTSYAAGVVLRAPESSEQVSLRAPIALPEGGMMRASREGTLPLMVERRRPWQGGSLASLGRRCLRVDAVIPPDRVLPVMEIEFGGDRGRR